MLNFIIIYYWIHCTCSPIASGRAMVLQSFQCAYRGCAVNHRCITLKCFLICSLSNPTCNLLFSKPEVKEPIICREYKFYITLPLIYLIMCKIPEPRQLGPAVIRSCPSVKGVSRVTGSRLTIWRFTCLPMYYSHSTLTKKSVHSGVYL